MAGTKRNKNGNDNGALSVLVVRFSAVGDVAMTIPVVYSACRSYPDVHFTLLTRITMVSMFVDSPANLTVVGVDLDEYKGVAGMWRLTREIVARYSIDMVVDLHDVLRSRLIGLFCRLRGIRVVTINKGRSHKRALTRARNKVMLPLPSQRARYRQTFFNAGLPVTDSFRGLFGAPGAADPTLFASISAPKGVAEKWVGIAPFAAHAGKIYPPEMMQQVVDAVAAMPGVRIFLLGGGAEEQRLLEGWAARHANVESLAGKKFGFAAEMALMNHMDAVLTMDSANMHLAAIACAPTISIWGATHPYCGFRGWRQTDADMIQLPLTCRPCSVFGNKPCHRHDYLCLTGIKPEVIVARVAERLGTTPQAQQSDKPFSDK